ncbi:MAG: glycerol-3-phosphate 1-O-acyltransferase PlsY [Synergistaceae bacterium]|jgi:glycerol-3-phosphate acyltransferase PlsY|nr:glycerol-3-phosphate 1-O-acyltransferase PlsY [Synergistaceae bacterium]
MGSSLAAAVWWIFFGYLLGSCPTGFVIVKLGMGKDVRDFGSGNIGATNVARVMGRKWAILTAVVDMLKGGVAMIVARSCGVSASALLALVGIAGVLGHDYPVWLKFNGGKGVAATFGVFACFGAFNPLPAIIGGVVWLFVREATRMVSLSSMVALLAAALVMPFFGMDRAYYLSGLLLAALTTWRHRENIKRIIAGTENKVGRFFFK